MPVVSRGPLKEYLKTRKKPTVILGRLDRYLQLKEGEDRPTDVLHPSEIIAKDWCLRGSYHLLRGETSGKGNPNLRAQVVFEEGHDIHDKWQHWLADDGILWGDYGCMVCDSANRTGHRVRSLGYPDHPCQVCGYSLWKYAELSLSIPSLRISGHTDGWLKLPDLGDHLLEIKSIGPGTLRYYEPSLLSAGSLEKAFTQISRPFAGHVRQIQIYLECARRMYPDAPDRALVLYECKANQQPKEFVVERNSDIIADVLDNAYDLVRMVDRVQEPPCSNNPAKGCAQCKEFAA